MEITRVPATKVVGADGHTSYGAHPAKVRWMGGRADLFEAINKVVVLDSKTQGTLERLHGDLCRAFNPPRDVPGGVTFEVLDEAVPVA